MGSSEGLSSRVNDGELDLCAIGQVDHFVPNKVGHFDPGAVRDLLNSMAEKSETEKRSKEERPVQVEDFPEIDFFEEEEEEAAEWAKRPEVILSVEMRSFAEEAFRQYANDFNRRFPKSGMGTCKYHLFEAVRWD